MLCYVMYGLLPLLFLSSSACSSGFHTHSFVSSSLPIFSLSWLALSLSLWRLSLTHLSRPRNSAAPAWSAQCGLTFYICACPRASKKRKRKIDDGKKVPLALFILLALFFFFLFFTHTLPTDWKTRENRHRWGNVTMVVGRQR